VKEMAKILYESKSLLESGFNLPDPTQVRGARVRHCAHQPGH